MRDALFMYLFCVYFYCTNINLNNLLFHLQGGENQMVH